MRLPFADSPEFRKLLARDSQPDLIRVALEIARDAYPELEIESYLLRVDDLASRVRERCPNSAKIRHVLGQINWVLFVEEGFQGNRDDYYDPRNSYLNEVLDRKTGIPISLSILYWTLAKRLGVAMEGVNLPAHFMLRVGQADSTIFIDPFHSGELLDRQGCERRVAGMLGEPAQLTDDQFAPCSLELVVLRMLRNLKAIYLRNQDFPTVLPVQRRLAALGRDEPRELRDLGMLCLQLDRPAEAIAPLQSYLEAQPDSEDADPIHTLLRAARREVSTWN